MRLALCPYCNGEHFSSAVLRADAVNPEDPEKYAKVYGHWFNQCLDCEGWSIHRNGKQFKLKDKTKKPKPYSEPAI